MNLADRSSPEVQEGLRHYCSICHRAPGFDCTNPTDGGPLPGRVIHIDRATKKGHTMTAPNEFAPLIYVDLVEAKPQSPGEWAADNPDAEDDGYSRYLDRFQPWRLLVKSGDNHEPQNRRHPRRGPRIRLKLQRLPTPRLAGQPATPDGRQVTLTAKQKAWDWLKAETRADRANRRIPIRGLIDGPVRRQKCPCPHTMKHHKRSGRCRRGCDCTAGATR